MKIAIFLFLTSSALLICSRTFSQDTINWRPDYKLKWEDFQGKPDTTSEHGAVSTIQTKYSSTNSEKNFTFKIYCFFEKNKSWVRVYTDDGLIHEQGHFNISELFARKLRMAFENYKFNLATVSQDVKKIFSQINSERRAMDALYDKETDFHRDSANQEKWNKKIAKELTLSQKYAN